MKIALDTNILIYFLEDIGAKDEKRAAKTKSLLQDLTRNSFEIIFEP